jgi:hypothetical protein
MVAGISLARQYVRAGFVLADLDDHPSAAAALASEASIAGGADLDRTEPVLGESPIDRIRAILHEARNRFPELREADVCLRTGARRERFFFALCEYLPARHGIRVRALAVGDRRSRGDNHRWRRCSSASQCAASRRLLSKMCNQKKPL